MARATSSRILAGVILLASTFATVFPPSVAAAGLDVFICAGPYALVDANKPGEEGPMVLTICASVTNNSGTTCNNIDVYIGDGTTPGAFTVGTDSTTSLSLPGCAADAHRFIPSLADGESRVLMWQIAYPPTFDVTYDFMVWAESVDGTCDGSDSHSLTTRSSLTAAANKVLGTVTVDPPGGTVSAGNIIEVTSSGFNFGQVGNGYSNEEDAWLQPIGNLGFDPCCFRLVETEVLITSIDGTPEPPYYPMPYLNRLYYPGIKSQISSPDPDYAQNDNDYVIYRFIALSDCSTVIQPYQEVASGEVQKYSGDFADDDATVTLTSDGSAIELEKSVSPSSADVGETLTWTIDYTNATDLPVGAPDSGAALVIIDQGIPAGTEYVSGTATCSDSCIIYYSVDNGATWDIDEPGTASDVNMIKWYITEVIEAYGTGNVSFQTEVTEVLSPICNTATAQIGEADVIAETTTCANVPPDVEATKVNASMTDNDSDNVVSPGDGLEYEIVLSAEGDADADGVVYYDSLDPYVELVVGSVTTTQGTVTVGNTSGDTAVSIDVGTLSAGSPVTITYEVVIDNPLAEGVTYITNQGIAIGDNFPSEPTDDPDTGTDDDPTVVPVTSTPVIQLLKTDSLYDDVDSDGVPSPGDIIEYSIAATNVGNQAGTAALLIDPTPDYTSLVVGSVTTTQGTVTEGNTAGDTLVEIDIGTLVGDGGSVTIAFRVAIDDLVPVEVQTIANQAIVHGGNFVSVLSDDPDTATPDDPTETPITAAPDLEVYKRACHCNDADEDGFPSAGDNLTYTITISNNGNQEARDVVFTDTLDSNTSYVADSVSTSQGTVISEDPFEIQLGAIAPEGEVEISFTVTIEAGDFTQVANQGLATGTNFNDEPSDDPDTPADDDPTVTAVVTDGGEPLIESYKTDTLVVDADGSGNLSHGDTVEYVVEIHNHGTAAAENVIYTDSPDPNTDLVVGSVLTSQGTVVSGNSVGDTTVQVDIGSLPIDGTVTIDYRVSLQPGTYDSIGNQGVVEADDVEDEPTDDPATGDDDDPTDTDVNSFRVLPPNVNPVGGEALRPDKTSIISGLLLLVGAFIAVPFVLRRALNRI